MHQATLVNTTIPASAATSRVTYEREVVATFATLFAGKVPANAPAEDYHPVRDMPRCRWYGQHRPDGNNVCQDCGETR